MKSLNKSPSRGFTLVSVVIFTLAVTLSLTTLIISDQIIAKRESKMRDELVAQQGVSELIEFFRAMNGAEFDAYLKVNRSDPALAPYPLCAHVNILDRSKEVADGGPSEIVNPNPDVEMGFTRLDRAGNSRLKSNRFYQVNIVDVTTNTLLDTYCDSSSYVYDPVAKPNERFFVTVGISWVPSGATITQIQRIALSTILPE